MKKMTIIAILTACVLLISCFAACNNHASDTAQDTIAPDQENAAGIDAGEIEEQQPAEEQPQESVDSGDSQENDGAQTGEKDGNGETGENDAAGENETAEPATDSPGMMALTFDDGPSKENTPVLLDGLQKRDIRATFFVLGVRAQANTGIIERAHAAGNVICSHGYDHKERFTNLSAEGLADQLDRTAKIIYQITESYPPYVRPPYGAIDQSTAARIPHPMMLWTVDTRDWDVKDADIVCQNIVDAAKDGAVILLHDLYATSVEGALKAVDRLTAEGWQFVTLPELYKHLGITPEPGKVYRGGSLATLK
ncbi:MAG: polysaccharide deacetylase family protein [Firmicutes bacterium]|nr:polysaccharide deacetylase family protein [Bacillota bacterium]